ncbi:Sec-independent protein translocase subunit TatA [Pseudonocardia alni]|uniref:Sec-independent protein translocase protein TatA n=1 Tax=Pseudonocardia alni TaxID=33907 RepID=A0A852W460_PSEA5|nr:Sec-independent protein translocase subunit TatA [Pseudonocardia antarctica]NYG03240.1 sec-independent protein translocase protein TatA [Pseudonocardia antarctica]
MGAMSPTHWLIVLVVLVLLFGAKKLPEMARSVGRSSRILKSEMRGLRDDERPGEIGPGGAPRADTEVRDPGTRQPGTPEGTARPEPGPEAHRV